jgi:hypothetical protein
MMVCRYASIVPTPGASVARARRRVAGPQPVPPNRRPRGGGRDDTARRWLPAGGWGIVLPAHHVRPGGGAGLARGETDAKRVMDGPGRAAMRAGRVSLLDVLVMAALLGILLAAAAGEFPRLGTRAMAPAAPPDTPPTGEATRR